jgi:phosphoglycolate phosphatase-like HAD superfamily hydrolase
MAVYIWDLDGTLLDSYGVIVEGARLTAQEAGLTDTAEEVLWSVKRESVTAYLRDASVRTGIPLERMKERYRVHTHALDDRITLVDGAAETLERLRSGGAEHYVYTHRGASSGPILKRLGILELFRDMVTSEMKLRPKPSGEGAAYLIRKYGLEKDRTAYVGDRALDVLCAKDAGIRAVLYCPEDSCVKPAGNEDLVIGRLEELLNREV